MAWQRAKRAAALQCILRMQQGALGRMFRAWRAAALELADLRSRAQLVIASLADLACARAFATWAGWTNERRSYRCTCNLVLPHFFECQHIDHLWYSLPRTHALQTALLDCKMICEVVFRMQSGLS